MATCTTFNNRPQLGILESTRRLQFRSWNVAQNGRPGVYLRTVLRLNYKSYSGRGGEMADAADLKSVAPKGACGFEPLPRHHLQIRNRLS